MVSVWRRALSPLKVPGLLLSALVVSSCGSCGAGGASADPRQYLDPDAELVVEVSDLAALSELRVLVERRFSKIIPPEDIVVAQEELQRALGFDPLTKEGLTEAGLKTSGPVAATVSDDGGLWVFPVADAAKARATVERLVQARSTADKTSETIAGAQVDVYSGSFGDTAFPVAAFTVRNRLGFLGMGPDAKTELEAALTRSPEASMLKSPDYLAATERLSEKWLLRTVLPKGAKSMPQGVGQSRLAEKSLEGVKSAGWALDADEAGLSLQGRVTLNEQALGDVKAIFATDKGLSEGVRSIDLPGAVLYATVNGDAGELLKRIAPRGSRSRRRLNRMFTDLGMKPEDEVMSELTGQLALAMGLGSLEDIELKQIVGNPLSVMWTAIALGVENPETFTAVDEGMAAKLKERGFEAKKVTVSGKEVNSVVRMDDEGSVLVQSFTRKEAVVFANEPAATEGILNLAPGLDPLKGRAGAVVELRIGRLAQQLRSFQISRLPLMFRSMVSRGLDALTVFEDLKFVIRPVDDGLSIDGTLELADLPVDK